MFGCLDEVEVGNVEIVFFVLAHSKAKMLLKKKYPHENAKELLVKNVNKFGTVVQCIRININRLRLAKR